MNERDEKFRSGVGDGRLIVRIGSGLVGCFAYKNVPGVSERERVRLLKDSASF